MRLISLCLASILTIYRCYADDTAEVQLGILNKLKNKVNSKIRPSAGGGPVSIYCSLHILSLGSISEINMDYTMDFYLRTVWHDTRMEFDELSQPITVPAKQVDEMWTPALYFPNEKSARLHMMTVPNHFMRIYPNGSVFSSIRLTMTLSSPMMLSSYPLDSQELFFKIESFTHDATQMILHWSKSDHVTLDEELSLPQFDLEKIDKVHCSAKYLAGGFSCLKLRYKLHRQRGFYLLQVYLPTFMVVIISWVSFWLNADAVPARISLGVTTVLTMATQLTGAARNAPKVSYPKAIDVWLATCMVFVFASQLEYAMVHVIDRSCKEKQLRIAKHVEHITTMEIKENLVQDPPYKCCQLRSSPNQHTSERIDHLSRIMFPSAFMLFSIFYWTFYTSVTVF